MVDGGDFKAAVRVEGNCGRAEGSGGGHATQKRGSCIQHFASACCQALPWRQEER